MSFLKSVLFGSEGSYNIFGIQVDFVENKMSLYNNSSNLKGAGFIFKVAIKLINSNMFCLVTQGYAHVFVHEMSHALTFKLFTNEEATIKICKSSCLGESLLTLKNLPDWKKTIVQVAGPVGSIVFSTCKLVATTALKSYFSWPIALTIGSGAVIWMSGELLYAYTSALNKDKGDFGCIARYGDTYLALASAVLVSQCALGIFAAIKFSA